MSWYEVNDNETIEECLTRMKKDGYEPIARKEEPIFQLIDGQPEVLKQKIKFKVRKIEK